MKEETINGHKVVYYDGGVQSLPVTRFIEFNVAVSIDAGIGSGWDSVDQHLERVMELMDIDLDAAKQELINCRGNYQFIISRISPEMNSFVPFIYSIDGEVLTDLDMTDEGKQKIIARLGKMKLSYGKFIELLTGIKKKINDDFDLFFPEIVDNHFVKEYYSKLKQQLLFRLDRVLGEEDLDVRINALSKFLLGLSRPKVYTGHDGVEVQMITGFDDSCQLLQQMKIELDPRRLTTLQFFRALNNAKRQLDKK